MAGVILNSRFLLNGRFYLVSITVGRIPFVVPYKTLEAERERCRKYAAANKEKIAARLKRWRAANKEKIAAYEKAYRENNKERYQQWWKDNRDKASEYRKNWRKNNPEKAKEIDRNGRIKYADRIRTYEREYAAAHREKFRAGSKKWRIENPERVMDNSVRYRTKKRSTGQRLSHGLTKRLYAQQNGLCAICRLAMDGVFHRDHIMPISKGGKHEDSNIQLTHPKCNLSKGSKLPTT